MEPWLPGIDVPSRKLDQDDPSLVHLHPKWRKDVKILALRLARQVGEASPRKDRCSPFAWSVACGDGRQLEIYVYLLRVLELLELCDADTRLLLALADSLLSTDAFQVSSVTWRPLLATSLRCALSRALPDSLEAARLFEEEMHEWWTIDRADAAYDVFLRRHVSLLMGLQTQKRGDGSWSLNSTPSTLFSVQEEDDDDDDEWSSDNIASI